MLTKAIQQGFVKDVDVSSGIVCGYFANFGTKDSDGDIIVKGAFAKTIRENGPEGSQLIKHLLDHDKFKVIGKITDLKEDSTGLYYESKAGRHTLGRDFLLMAEDGLINQHSFGYRVIKEARKSDGNYLHELAMKEGSSIQFLGANSQTPLVGIKSEEDLIDAIQLFTKAFRDGKYSDETFVQLEQHINELNKSLIEVKPRFSTSMDNEPMELITHFKTLIK